MFGKLHKSVLLLQLLVILVSGETSPAEAQQGRTKVRISNAGFTITALPLLAAKDWGVVPSKCLGFKFVVQAPSPGGGGVAEGLYHLRRGCRPAPRGRD